MKYILNLITHKYHVFVCGKKMGKIPAWRLFIHDWTRLMPDEIIAHLRKDSKGGRKYAKILHARKNPHHYQFWMVEGEPVPMPEVFVREMIVDWLAYERVKENPVPLGEWLSKAYPTMKLHPKTSERLYGVLLEIGIEPPFKKPPR